MAKTAVEPSPTGVSPQPTTRGLRLSGVSWLTWRQHRAAYWTLLAVTALSVAWMAYQRSRLTGHLTAEGWPAAEPESWIDGIEPYALAFDKVTFGLGFLPVLLGVFLGAPLLAVDLESGTAKLIASQSAGRVRWLAAKLAITTLVVVACTTVLSVAFGWWWQPVKGEVNVMEWTSGPAFDNTGPVPVALTLFTVMGGVAIGMLLRRTLLAMVFTCGFGAAVQGVWTYFRLDLGQVVTITTDDGIGADALPDTPYAAYQVDQSYITGSGTTLPWSTCAHEASDTATDACIAKADIVGWSVDYLPISHMSSMQWLGASILFALTAAIAAFVFLRGRKRLF